VGDDSELMWLFQANHRNRYCVALKLPGECKVWMSRGRRYVGRWLLVVEGARAGAELVIWLPVVFSFSVFSGLLRER